MNYIITGSGYVSNLIKEAGSDIQIISEREFAQSDITLKQGDKVYSPTESAMDIILKRSDDNIFRRAVSLLKDKFEFRQIMSAEYPDFFFEKVKLRELEKIDLDRSKKYIVKPVKGFFSTAVKVINQNSDIKKITDEIKRELRENSRYFPESVLSHNELIIEEFAKGDEYAVDMYYDKDGNPQILNIYHHPFPENNEYFNVLYYTNHRIFNELYEDFRQIFLRLNKILQVSGFPIHAEFKLDGKKLIPIEMNPLRLGGFGLADLSYHAFGFNPFEAYFTDFKPDWMQIWDKRKTAHFGWVLGYNGKNINTKQFAPDDEAYLNYLKNVLHYVEIDYRKNPVFSIAYLKSEKESALRRLLKTEFNDFFVKKEIRNSGNRSNQ